MDSDDNFMIYRRFGFLYSRVLLSKQDELRQLEEDLDALDRSDASGTDRTRKCLKSQSKDYAREKLDGVQTRKELLQAVESKLYQYGSHCQKLLHPRCMLMGPTGQYLLQAHQVVTMSKPAARDHLSVKNFLENGFGEEGRRVRPLMQADSEFIYRNEDLVTLRPGRESAWLDAFVERFLKMINCKPVQVSSILPCKWCRESWERYCCLQYAFCSKVCLLGFQFCSSP